MPDGPCKAKAIEMLQGKGWYEPAREVYRAHAKKVRVEIEKKYQPLIDSGEATKKDLVKAIKARLKGYKVEVQRQLLFNADSRAESNPVAEAYRKVIPVFLDWVKKTKANLKRLRDRSKCPVIRQTKVTTLLSDKFTNAEGDLFLDRVFAALERAGIRKALSNNDAVIVKRSDAETAQEVVAATFESILGFRPLVVIK